MYYQVKINILRAGKHKKELYIVQAYNLPEAETIVITQLQEEGLEEVTDVNQKDYATILRNIVDGVNLGGYYYEVKIEWDDVDGKVVKETYLIQAATTGAAEAILYKQAGDSIEIVSTVKKNYIDYLEVENEE